ncbi:DUF2971 domain-containing protein [Cloacibacterium normanense]
MNNNDLSKLIQIGVDNHQIPQYLFKYRTIDSTIKILENNSLWFSKPNEFNDPFDCQIIPNTENTLEEIESFIRRNSKNKLNNREVKNLAFETFNTPNRWKQILENTFSKIINNTGICCFARNEKNLLMWSHYSNFHKGVCIKFDILKDKDFFVYPLSVNYRDDYPNYNHLKSNDKDLVNDIVLSKSKDWCYEQEIRVIKIKKNGLIEFKKDSLVEIIFGCKTSNEDIEKIVLTAKQKKFNIKFKKAKKKNREFALEIIDF